MENDAARRNWSGGAAGWLDNETVLDALFAPVTQALLDVADLRPGDRVLEVGCGSGALLEQAAAQGARTVGVDISPGMVAAARDRVPAATLMLGDAQTLDLGAPVGRDGYDVIASRFGVMFFDDPVAAFGNLRRVASIDNGLLAFASWGSRADNPMFTLGTEVLARRVEAETGTPLVLPDPGPTSLSEPDRIHAVLADAGWTSVCLDRLDFTCDYGAATGSDGVAERVAVVLGTTTGRLAAAALRPRLGEGGWAELVAEVGEEVRATLDGPSVRHPARAWLVTAANLSRSGAVGRAA